MEQYFASHAGPLLAVFLAAFLQSITGFGLVMIMAPLLMMFYEPKFAVILVIIIASCGNISQALMLRKETRYKTILWLFIGSLAGQPVGYLMYHLFPSEAVRLWVNLIVLFSITLMLICHWKIRQCTRNTAITGAISGITSISSGIGGPPLLIYFARTDMTPAVLRATSISSSLRMEPLSIVMPWAASMSCLPSTRRCICCRLWLWALGWAISYFRISRRSSSEKFSSSSCMSSAAIRSIRFSQNRKYIEH